MDAKRARKSYFHLMKLLGAASAEYNHLPKPDNKVLISCISLTILIVILSVKAGIIVILIIRIAAKPVYP